MNQAIRHYLFFIYICGTFISSSSILAMLPPEDPKKSNLARKRLFTDENDQNGPNVPSVAASYVIAHTILMERELDDSSDESDEEEGDKNEPDIPSKRLTPLKSIFTRNYPKFENQVQQAAASPERRAALIREAEGLTPFLSSVYRENFRPAQQEDITPVKTTERHKRKRARKPSVDEVRQHADAHLPNGGWSAITPQAMNYGPIYQRDELINPFLEDDQGRTNLERMYNGLAPLGPDARHEPINLHHVIQGVDAGHIAELSATLHRRETAVLHRGAPGIENRDEFDDFRRMYWQARAFNIIESRFN